MNVSCYYCGYLCPFAASIVYFYEGSCYIIWCINIHKECSCLENPRDGGAWWAAVYGVAQSRTGLKRLSSCSSRARVQLQQPGYQPEGWAVSAGNDVASDSRYGTTCLFQASASLLYLFKSVRSEVWHFQFSLTQIIVSLLPFQVPASVILSESCLLVITLNSCYVWAAYHISQFISYLSKSCLPLVS